jgi:thermitase
MKVGTRIVWAMSAVLLVLVLAGAGLGENGVATDGRAKWVEGQFIVQFKAGVFDRQAEDIISSMDCSIVRKGVYCQGAYLVKPNAVQAALQTEISKFRMHPNVQFAELDYVYDYHYEPDDPRFRDQWGLAQIKAPEAWDVSQGDENVLVCICDSGIKSDHPDLSSKIEASQNFTGIGAQNDVTDNVGHGTHVSGIAAAATDNGIGVAGVSFDCKLLMAKVGEFWMDVFSVSEGIEWGATNGAAAINLSLGGGMPSDLMHNAIIDAVSRGSWVVASSGNASAREFGYVAPVEYPAAFDECIAVGATGMTGLVADYSCAGPELDLAAPGGDTLVDPATGGILSTVPDRQPSPPPAEDMSDPSGYAYAEGTSMAAPHVTGAIGLLVAAGISRQDARLALESTAVQPGGGSGGFSNDYGHGIIDLEAALGVAGIGVKITEPTAGEIIEYQTPEVRCTLRNARKSTILLSVDNVPVVSDALGNVDDYYDAAAGTLIYRTEPLGPGSHTVDLYARNLQGKEGSDSVTFLIIPHEQIGGLAMWSVPYDISEDVLGGAYSVLAGSNYTLFWWDPAEAEWRIYRSYAQPRDLEASLDPPDAGVRPEGYPTNVSTPPRGCGRFLFLDGKTQMTVLSSVVPRQAYEMDLYGGWNMIGHPFPFLVGWNVVKFKYKGYTKTLEDAIAADWIRPTLYRYVRPPGAGSGYYSWDSAPNGYLRPWEAHWVYVSVDTSKTLSGGGVDPKGFPLTMIVPAATSKGREPVEEDMDDNPNRGRSQGRDDFRLQITGACGELLDRYNFLGVASGAANGADRYDVMDPPTPGENITIGFVHRDWGRLSGLYGEDVRAEIGQGQTWNIQVTTTVKQGRATLSWPNVSRAPTAYQYLLYDPDTKRTVNLRSRASYTFAVPQDGSPKTFRLTVKPDSLAGLRITDVVAAPTRGGASVSYNLTRDAEVSVRVTSLTGRRIRELAAGSRGPGIGTVAWDGKDAQGRTAPRGLYVFEVIARGEDGRMVRAVAPGAIR